MKWIMCRDASKNAYFRDEIRGANEMTLLGQNFVKIEISVQKIIFFKIHDLKICVHVSARYSQFITF